MHFFHSFTVFLTWLASVRLEDPIGPLSKAQIAVSFGEPQLFTGEDVSLSCSVPDGTRWRYQWFQNGVSVGFGNVFNIKEARFQQGGTYTCRGIKSNQETSVLSDPLHIQVNGGWVLMQHPVKPLFAGQQMTLTCRVRDNPLLSDIMFYKDGLKIKTQNENDLVFPFLSIEDDGTYSCRAMWLKNQEYESGQSLPSTVTVLDKVETPRLALITDPNQVRIGKDVVFNCITKVNTGPLDLRIEYHFKKDDVSLGPVSSEDTFYIPRASEADAGNYSCIVYVRDLNEEKSSNQVELVILPG